MEEAPKTENGGDSFDRALAEYERISKEGGITPNNLHDLIHQLVQGIGGPEDKAAFVKKAQGAPEEVKIFLQAIMAVKEAEDSFKKLRSGQK